MKRAIVLGAGRVGAVMASDLAADPGYQVTVADVRPLALARLEKLSGVRVIRADLASPDAVKKVVADHDLVLGALSSRLGLQTLRAVIEAGKSYCDISFMPEDGTVLSDLARARGVTAIIDCGVSPGVSNMMVGYAAGQLDACDRVDIFCGGLPLSRTLPFQYKAGFAPEDAIEIYTRPARVVDHGEVVVREAGSEAELVEIPGLGTLEAFSTDGLRSLLATIQATYMREKTLRYPGHLALVRVFGDLGFFSKEPIDIGGQRVRPLDVTGALLFPRWTYEEGEGDLTAMRVVVEGRRGGAPVRYAWDLLDRYDAATETTSMSRVTGLPATIMARFLAEGRFTRPGVHPPEIPAREPGILDAMLRQLGERGVRYHAHVEPLAKV